MKPNEVVARIDERRACATADAVLCDPAPYAPATAKIITEAVRSASTVTEAQFEAAARAFAQAWRSKNGAARESVQLADITATGLRAALASLGFEVTE